MSETSENTELVLSYLRNIRVVCDFQHGYLTLSQSLYLSPTVVMTSVPGDDTSFIMVDNIIPVTTGVYKLNAECFISFMTYFVHLL